MVFHCTPDRGVAQPERRVTVPVLKYFFRFECRLFFDRFFKRIRRISAQSIETGRAAIHLFFLLQETVPAFAIPEFVFAETAKREIRKFCHDGSLPGFGLS
jgi:hypothetical protein